MSANRLLAADAGAFCAKRREGCRWSGESQGAGRFFIVREAEAPALGQRAGCSRIALFDGYVESPLSVCLAKEL